MKHRSLSIPPQKDVITLEAAISRTTNWRNAIRPLYRHDENKAPHAIFIPFEDILELQKLAGLINTPGTETPIYIVGARAYFSLEEPMPSPDQPITPGNQLAAVLVPVYQTNRREPGEEEFDYNPDYPTYDLIVPVLSAGGRTASPAHAAGEDETYTIYDITRPCPNLCDTTSPLFGPVPDKQK